MERERRRKLFCFLKFYATLPLPTSEIASLTRKRCLHSFKFSWLICTDIRVSVNYNYALESIVNLLKLSIKFKCLNDHDPSSLICSLTHNILLGLKMIEWIDGLARMWKKRDNKLSMALKGQEEANRALAA